MKSLKFFLCEKALARKDGSPEELYSREEDASACAWRVSDCKGEETLIVLVNY
jgi:hypothetical protein